jgi:hypothetical protein
MIIPAKVWRGSSFGIANQTVKYKKTLEIKIIYIIYI